MNFPENVNIESDGGLSVGGCLATDLAAEYGTPLFVYDETAIRKNIRAFHKAFRSFPVSYTVAYASKAFCTKAMVKLIAEEGCALDVVSGGELYTALAAGMNPRQIHFHGNNKSHAELEYAVTARIGAVVVDNFDELAMLNRICELHKATMRILLRVAPGVEAHTHEYIATGQQDSKFGFDVSSGQARQALLQLQDFAALDCMGLHAHIGSQIFDSRGFLESISRLSQLYEEAGELGLDFSVINLGGGFGVRYTDADEPAPVSEIISEMVQTVMSSFTAKSLKIPEIWVEPGRAVVATAGITLYTVGSRKQIEGVRNYVSVDGGMTDNPRLALYGSQYEAILANRPLETARRLWSVAGKSCESGDMLIWDISLPDPEPGDILCVFATGAYNYSMASHYNRIPNPAVVFVKNGASRLVVRRETWADVARNDCDVSTRQEGTPALSASSPISEY